MEAWLAPAFVAAIVSGIVNVAGWFVTFRIGLRRDRLLRTEKVRDFQVALRAEIRSHRKALEFFDDADQWQTMLQEIAAGDLVPLIPKKARPLVFEAIVGEIHILPTEIVDPVVLYYGQYSSVEAFADEFRGAAFAAMPADRRARMFADYLSIGHYAGELADIGVAAIDSSLTASSGVQ